MKLKGTITALITPFIDHELDENGLKQNIVYQISQGINGLLVLGCTGEVSTLSSEEQERIISIAGQNTKGKVPLWVGTGTCSTTETIERTNLAKNLGADIALIIAPYANKPTQEGIYRHFKAISENVDLPIVIYNNPGRCCVNIETPTLLRIAELPNIIGVKESSGNIFQVADIIHTVIKKYPHFNILSGDDVSTLPMMALGATGVVSVASNLIPAQVVASVEAALHGNFDAARELHTQFYPIFKAVFLETNPMPIKAMMDFCGLPAGNCRLPLSQMSPEHLKQVEYLLIDMQLAEALKV